MNGRKGIFIVIEGSDGSGKTTQFNLLKERLKAIGYEIEVFDFPRYDKQSSYFVQKYLNGDYGPAARISPYTTSLFYALDRYEAGKDIAKALNQGKIVLANRYVGSNMAHQGAKFSDPAQQRGFFVWEDNLEFQMLGIPRADINLFLRVPAEISIKLIQERSKKTGQQLDEHEKDHGHLKKALVTYDLLCRLFPKDFRAIECTFEGKLLSIPEISNLIWEQLLPKLPKDKPNPSHSVVVTLGLNDSKPANHSSRAQNDLVIPFKNASLLLRLQIERSQPDCVTSKKIGVWAETDYAFYTPSDLPRELTATYKQIMERIAKLQISARAKLVQYFEKNQSPDSLLSANMVDQIVEPLTPLAALNGFEVDLKKPGVVPLASRLLASDIAEVVWAAQQLYLFARQTWPKEFANPLESQTGPESINHIIAKLATERLGLNSSAAEPVRLLEAYPRQEFDLLSESIYPFSNLSLEEITEEVADWPYLQKFESLKQAVQQPGLLSKVRYKMDIISDQIVLSELARAAGLRSVHTQALTPRYGYDVPAVIEMAGLDDLYNECFDESLKLFSLLQAAGRDDLTGYATLLGHRARWQLSTDADSLLAALKPGSARHYLKTAESITEKVAEVHPLLWEIVSGGVGQLNLPPKNGKARIKPAHQPPKRKPRSKK